MHTLHYFAVEAQDKEEAFELVQSRLSTEDGDRFVEWSDWHVVGGGRWSNSQYEDSSEMVLSYAEEPEKFKEAIEGIKKARVNEMNRYLSQLNYDKFVSDIVDYISEGGVPNNESRFDLNAYYFNKVGDMLMDSYCTDSYFYDLKEYTAHMGYLPQRLDNSDTAKLQYLVPVDFHF